MIALDLDNAVAYRLLVYDNKLRTETVEASAKMTAREVAKMWTGESDASGDYSQLSSDSGSAQVF
jgi:hypothetical protein